MTHAIYWLDYTYTIDNLLYLQRHCIPLCGQIHIHLIMYFTCMHVVAEAGLLAQRALFMSHRLLGPNVAIEAIELPADDIFFPFQ